ncbi:glycoside hydrolase family 88 protein [Microbacterium imperiale]|uniref:Glycosyl hydrolase n=1 Tax=Microbacterium imperiale TaxID=33884 RepID=A0A9W6HI61_9MICO|nr:glycoside hydrolase family 88 protein [Microbacterium imperiale]MBP2421506.1 unsaturated chondroitin disaccharide hydrolase [Microbacterium imperiale]MDS0199386.1 glycoside hydrolase family 88 protein [Microbacterium imperiale]BFE41845.1 glycoside hydrolase family 88 protein [Microbacterium imperiale]GLJ80797.1 glycosyl hydrolase [Microbacterium imperiale]
MTSLPGTDLDAPAGPAPADPAAIEAAIAAALTTLRRNIETFGLSYPDDTTDGDRYPIRPAAGGFAAGANRGWTTSFWPGMMWIAWELTGDAFFRDAGLAHAEDFARRVRDEEDLDTHDLGFLYTLASVAPYRLLGDEDARASALDAADHLMRRFLEPAGIVQAWGDLSDPTQRGRTIVDSLMNMPLLTWAGEQTGEERFADAVRRHTTQLRTHILRDDDTTFHTFYWDAETGEPLRGATEQGAFDDSCWARGQAWGVYGFALNHRATGDPALLDASRRCAERFLSKLPSDRVPFWDMVYTDGADAPRDSSSAAIVVSGLFELADAETDAAAADRYRRSAYEILGSLIANYTPETPEASDAVILHSVYDFPKSVGVDEGTLWGDYFYLEALVRAARPGWKPYW